jgi:hypothetical protein
MTTTDPDELFAQLLADYDAQLIAGGAVASLESTQRDVSADLFERLEKSKKC